MDIKREREQLLALETLVRQDKIKEALELSGKLIVEFPSSFQIKFTKAKILNVMNRLGEAEEIIDELHQIHPDNINLLQFSCTVYEKTNKRKALDCYNKLLFVDPFNTGAKEKITALESLVQNLEASESIPQDMSDRDLVREDTLPEIKLGDLSETTESSDPAPPSPEVEFEIEDADAPEAPLEIVDFLNQSKPESPDIVETTETAVTPDTAQPLSFDNEADVAIYSEEPEVQSLPPEPDDIPDPIEFADDGDEQDLEIDGSIEPINQIPEPSEIEFDAPIQNQVNKEPPVSDFNIEAEIDGEAVSDEAEVPISEPITNNEPVIDESEEIYSVTPDDVVERESDTTSTNQYVKDEINIDPEPETEVAEDSVDESEEEILTVSAAEIYIKQGLKGDALNILEKIYARDKSDIVLNKIVQIKNEIKIEKKLSALQSLLNKIEQRGNQRV